VHNKDIPKTKPEIYRQIESFAGYSFCKAHSASYAVESYQSLYLKSIILLSLWSVINNQGGFIEPKSMCMKQNVRATIHNPCVNKSEFTTLYTPRRLFRIYAFARLSRKIIEAIVKERTLHGDYLSLEDFCNTE
jgi:DNA polymerase-3 subunit alpha/error-prone DNA polymerase